MLLFYETYLHSRVDEKTMLEARIKLILFCLKVEGLIYFDVLLVQIFMQQNIPRAMKF